jgi:histidinol phosphatase-like enzyme (inositol monophosphatase family)
VSLGHPPRLGEYLEFARDVAREAGDLTLRYFRTRVAVDTKADASPVTIADREAETLIRQRISARYPDHGIIGEEHGAQGGAGEYTWIIDPIDGTKSFVRGVPMYAVLVALVAGAWDGRDVIDAARVLAGVIHVPPLDETVSAARGLGATWDLAGKSCPARVSTTPTLAEAWIGTTDFADLARRAPEISARVVASGAHTRTWGDAYGYLLVATGRYDAMIDPIMSPWDVGPLPVVIEEAGGRFSDLTGRAVLGTSVVASNGLVREELLSAA